MRPLFAKTYERFSARLRSILLLVLLVRNLSAFYRDPDDWIKSSLSVDKASTGSTCGRRLSIS